MRITPGIIITIITLLLALPPAHGAAPAESARRASVAVLDFGASEAGRRAADRVAALLAGGAASTGGPALAVLDRGMSRAAARGVGYAGSLNLTLREARDLGAAAGCDFFVTGDAQTLRRSSSSTPVYYEAYASVFIVSARTGRLLLWDRPAAEAPTPEQAESSLANELEARTRSRYGAALAGARAREEEAGAREGAADARPDLLDLTSEDGAAAGVREPEPYRRLRPAYPDTAAAAEAEATVDASVEIDERGEVTRVEIVRWAGFGLDDAVAATVRQLYFRPATRGGVPAPARVLLRYNFRRPAKDKK